MKRNLFLTFSFLLFFTLFSSCQKEPIRVACVGDSITYGSGIENRDKTYPAVLNNLLGSKYDVRNFGVSGATNLHKGDKPYVTLQAYKDALAFNPDIVVIKLGTNDSKSYNWDVNKEDFKADLTALIDSFRALPAHPEIFLCLPAKAYRFNFNIRDEVIFNEIIPQIKQVAKDKKCRLIDLYKITSDMAENFPDGIHPNEQGAEIIARTIADYITEWETASLLIHSL